MAAGPIGIRTAVSRRSPPGFVVGASVATAGLVNWEVVMTSVFGAPAACT